MFGIQLVVTMSHCIGIILLPQALQPGLTTLNKTDTTTLHRDNCDGSRQPASAHHSRSVLAGIKNGEQPRQLEQVYDELRSKHYELQKRVRNCVIHKAT